MVYIRACVVCTHSALGRILGQQVHLVEGSLVAGGDGLRGSSMPSEDFGGSLELCKQVQTMGGSACVNLESQVHL